MDFDMHIEPIVSRDEIQQRARDDAQAGKSVHDNPYTRGSQAHLLYERAFWARDCELCSQEGE